jgi:hypothetical protein
MALRVVGAGLGRTGTNSLKLALERLLGGRCYHMYELIERPQDTASWESAIAGRPVDWNSLLHDYRATVDFPAAVFWREILEANPDAIVLLSSRDSTETWWASVEKTIVPSLGGAVPPDQPDWARRRAMNVEMMRTHLTPQWPEATAVRAAYERHNAEVRREVPGEHLIDWRPGDGWEPICAALGLAVPAVPFPHENTAADFQAKAGGRVGE